jgi:hypothetical protein
VHSDATETAASGQLVLSPAAHDALIHGAVGQAYTLTGTVLEKNEFLLEKIERSSGATAAALASKAPRGEQEEAAPMVDYEP